MSKQTFIQGTMILLAAGIINRLLGFVPRIVLPRIIGAEGVGLYQMGWPFLTVILTIISGGIPIAVAKLVAEAESEQDRNRVKHILSISLTLTLTLGLIFTMVCLASARWVTAHLLTEPRVYYTFISMSPIITIVGISSVLRGYFQGKQNMIPTATSQVAETVMRIIAVVFLAYTLLPYGVEYAAAGAMGGVVIGEICGFLVLMLHYSRDKRVSPLNLQVNPNLNERLSKRGNFGRLIRLGMPITAGRLVGSTSYFLESIMIMQSLAAAGVATAIATAQYGALQGMIIPILLLPSALTYSLSTSLIPSLSEAAAKKDMQTIHKRLHQSLRLALVTGAPFVVIMFVLADPLCYFLYHDREVASMLKMMAPVALFLYFQGPLQATLQALDKPGTALINTFIGACIKLILIYLLATKPEFGILGALIAININIVLVTALHWQSIAKLIGFSMQQQHFIKVGFAMLVMALISYLVMQHQWLDHEFNNFFAAGSAGLVVYLISIVKLKLVDLEDIARLPILGKRLARWLR